MTSSRLLAEVITEVQPTLGILYAFICGTLSLFILIANTLTWLIIFKSRRLQSTSNYFIQVLSLSGLSVSILLYPQITSIVLNSWMLGEAGCRIIAYLFETSMMLVSFLITALVSDRYYAIVRPGSDRFTRGKVKRLIGFLVILSLLICGPYAYIYNLVNFDVNKSRNSLIMLNNLQSDAFKNLSSSTTLIAQRCTIDDSIGVLIMGSVYLTLTCICTIILPAVLSYFMINKIWHRIKINSSGHLGSMSAITSGNMTQSRIDSFTLTVTTVNICNIDLLITQTLKFVSLSISYRLLSPPILDLFTLSMVLHLVSNLIRISVFLHFNVAYRHGCLELFSIFTKRHREENYATTKLARMGKKNHIGTANEASIHIDFNTHSPEHSSASFGSNKTSISAAFQEFGDLKRMRQLSVTQLFNSTNMKK